MHGLNSALCPDLVSNIEHYMQNTKYQNLVAVKDATQ